MRILAVNNDPFFQETLVQMQLQAPRDVIALAQTPKDAVDAVRTSRSEEFDCFLIQNKMAQRDQASLIPALRSTQSGASVPILVLTESLNETEEIIDTDPARLTGTAIFPLPIADLQDRIIEICAPKLAPSSAAPVAFDAPVPLSAELEIFDTPGIVTPQTLESYIGQLPRRKVYSASCFGLAIRDVELHHAALSAFDFHSLINDVADVISEEMGTKTALFTYTGHGVFVGFIEDMPNPQTQRIMRHVNARLKAAGLTDGDDIALDVRVSAGEAETFTWRSSRTAEGVLAQARAGAIAARKEQGELRDQFWFMDKSA